MILTRLEVDCFRNLESQALEPHPRFNLLCGSNGQGKTNVLEAIVVLSSLRSFRASRSGELLRFGAPRARVSGIVEERGSRQELEVELREGGRRALVGGKPVRTATAYLGKLATVLFAPEDLQLPRGTPSERRKHLDRAIAVAWPPYHELQRSFQRALQTRNRVLRDQGGGRQEDLLAVYDQQLAELGSRVVASRRRYVRALGERVAAVFADVSRSGQEGTVRYVSRGLEKAGHGLRELEEALGSLIQRARTADLARRTTTVGPQTDDLEFLLDGRPAGAFGSQGQLRSLVLAFKLAQMQEVFERVGSYPVLLLDDVGSELDPDRSNYLFDFIGKTGCQTFITSARPELLPVEQNSFKYQVVGGHIRELARG